MQHEDKQQDVAPASWRTLHTASGIPFHVCCATGALSAADPPALLPALRGGMFCDDPVRVFIHHAFPLSAGRLVHVHTRVLK